MNNVQAKSSQTRKAMLLEDAAKKAGASVDALRKRLQRGVEDGFKGNDGKWRVYVNSDWTSNRPSPGSSGQILETLLAQIKKRDADKDKTIDILSGQLAEKDRLINSLLSKIPNSDRVDEMQGKLDKQEAIVKRAYGIIRNQLKQDVA